jgi:hypothetical protein
VTISDVLRIADTQIASRQQTRVGTLGLEEGAGGRGSSVLKSIIKQAALKAFPDAALTFFSMRSRRFRERQCHERGLDRLARQVAEATTGKVTSGPFAGMILNYELLPTHAGCTFLGNTGERAALGDRKGN